MPRESSKAKQGQARPHKVRRAREVQTKFRRDHFKTYKTSKEKSGRRRQEDLPPEGCSQKSIEDRGSPGLLCSRGKGSSVSSSQVFGTSQRELVDQQDLSDIDNKFGNCLRQTDIPVRDQTRRTGQTDHSVPRVRPTSFRSLHTSHSHWHSELHTWHTETEFRLSPQRPSCFPCQQPPR